MISVLFLWHADDTLPLKRVRVWAKMPQVPDVGHHVHIPLGTFNEGGEEDTECRQVKRVYWVKDENQPDSWHAEVWVYDKGEFR